MIFLTLRFVISQVLYMFLGTLAQASGGLSHIEGFDPLVFAVYAGVSVDQVFYPTWGSCLLSCAHRAIRFILASIAMPGITGPEQVLDANSSPLY